MHDVIPGPKWAHQANHRSRHSEFCSWNCRHQRFHDLHYLSSRWRQPSCSKDLMTTTLAALNLSTYILILSDPKKTLGIKLPYLVMIIKNMKKYFTFEVQVSNWVFEWVKILSPSNLSESLNPGAGWQKCAKEIQSFKLSVHDKVHCLTDKYKLMFFWILSTK